MVRSLLPFFVRAERNADMLRYPARRIAWSRCLRSWLRVVVVVAIATEAAPASRPDLGW
jgi:hypothetical protein